MKFIDLFAGIGGFHIAFKKNVKNAKCVFVSEIDKNAMITYSNNFNYPIEKIINIRSLNNISKDVPDHDFLFAGFPCQTFSNAGNKMGFLDDVRGTLFFDIAKILDEKKPNFFLLENVKHLVNHDGGKTWNIICNTLKKLGYIIPKKPLIFSPLDFGIPQKRERVFILGIKKELKPEIDDIEINLDKYKKDILKLDNLQKTRIYIKKHFLTNKNLEKYLLKNQKNSNYLLRVIDAWDEFIKNVKTVEDKTIPVIWLDEFNKNYDINNFSAWRKKYIEDMRIFYNLNKNFIDYWMKKHNTNEWNKRERKFEWQAGKDSNNIKESFIQFRQSGIRCKKPNSFPTLVAMVQIPLFYDWDINEWRFLSPKEVSNLQSFPDDFKNFSELNTDNPKSDFYSFKQFGNSVNVHLVSLIIKEFLEKYVK